MKNLSVFCFILFVFSGSLIFGSSPGAGIEFAVSDVSVETNSKFQVQLDMYTYVKTISAATVMISFDSDLLKLDTDFYELDSLDVLPNNLITLQSSDDLGQFIEIQKPGVLYISYFDVNGFGPGQGSKFFTLHLESLEVVKSTSIQATIQSMHADDTGSISFSPYANVQISIVSPPDSCPNMIGDVNGDGVINIVDALLIAQYYVGYITEFPKR